MTLLHDLEIGRRFELDGAAYVKTSPVLAAFEAFHSACREELEKLAGALPASQLEALFDTIEEKRKGFLDILSRQ